MRRKNLKTRLSQICYFAFLASTFGAVIAPPFLTKATETFDIKGKTQPGRIQSNDISN